MISSLYPSEAFTWLSSTPAGLLPAFAITVVGDDEGGSVKAALNDWIRIWQRDLSAGVSALSQMEGETAHLVVIVAAQSRSSIAAAHALVSAGSENGFDRTICAIRGRYLTAEASKLARSCDVACIAEDAEALFHPLRLLASPSRLIGYDNADVFDLWRGRIGQVMRTKPSQFCSTIEHLPAAPAALSVLLPQSQECLQLASEYQDLIVSRFGDIDLLVTVDSGAEQSDTVELGLLQDPEWDNSRQRPIL